MSVELDSLVFKCFFLFSLSLKVTNTMDSEEYQPLIISVGEVVDQYKIIDFLGKHKEYEKFKAIHMTQKFFVDIKFFFKSPRLSKQAKKEACFMTIANTIDLRHRYFVKFYQHIDDRAIPILIFEHTGPTLAEQLDYMNGLSFNINTAKVIMWQLLHAIELLHESKIICGSISLENISLLGDFVDENGYEKKSGNRNIQVRINTFAHAQSGNQWHIDCNIPIRYQAPEALLGTRWSYETDLWALGVLFIELITGVKMFDTEKRIEHLAMIEKMGGDFPSWMLAECPTKDTDFDSGKVDIGTLNDDELTRIEKTQTLEDLFQSDNLVSFAKALLATDPSQRATPVSLFDHPFLQEI